MQTLTYEEAQVQLASLIERASQDQCKFKITSPEGNVILLPEETFQNLMITLEMFSMPILLDESQ